MSNAREEILGRIRSALKDAPVGPSYEEIPRSYDRKGKLDHEASLHLLKDRLLDYDSDIVEVTHESEIASAVAEALQRASEQQVLVAEAFPAAWLPSGIDVVRDTQLTTQQLDGLATVVTTCEAAVSATGTIILVHEGAQGRRAITLLPDHHICIVARSQVFELWPEAVAAIDARSRYAITTISGPSATSDIEMTRIRGVHGPRRLSVILYG
ncbi:LutC/YkgG family protein [Granulicella paludicola]|uniref:LutC/YkgG family protein n=1 Tax=Granulicella paludicola TaxID=474951 RepID=UPI0021E07266|nr:LUD domain-containing protein [Granulicella paludicola]